MQKSIGEIIDPKGENDESIKGLYGRKRPMWANRRRWTAQADIEKGQNGRCKKKRGDEQEPLPSGNTDKGQTDAAEERERN